MFYYIIRNKHKIKFIILIGIVFVLNNLAQIILNIDYSIYSEIQYFTKFIYNLLIFLITFDILQKERLINVNDFIYYLTISSLIYAVIVVISFILGFGIKTYSYGISSKGLFYAGNDLTAILAVVYPLNMFLYYENYNNKRISLLVYNIIILLSLTIVGTRVAFLAILISFVVFFLYFTINKNLELLKYFIMLLVTSSIAFTMFSYVAKVKNDKGILKNAIERQEINMQKTNNETVTYVLSSRNLKLKETLKDYNDAPILRKVFGLGKSTQKDIIEMDFMELFFYYGVLGFIILSYNIIKSGLFFIFNFFKNKNDLIYIAFFVSLFLGFGSSFLAGHVLFSASAGTFVFIILALSNYLNCSSSMR